MPKDLTHEVYQDKAITCRKCQKVIGETRLDGQILILESGLIVFNYLCWRCDCNRSASWLAPILPKDLPTIDNQIPDVGDIMHKALTLKEKAKKLGYRLKENHPGEQHQQTGKAQTSAS
jgi:hypothetical protein